VHLAQRSPEAPSDVWEPITGPSLDSSKAYRDFLFHGDCFQRIVSIDAISSEGIDAHCTISSPKSFITTSSPASRWLLDPGLIDVVPQLAIVWARAQHDTTPLPSRIGRLTFYRAPVSEVLQVQLRLDRFDGSSMTYRARLSDSSGLCLEFTEFEGSCSQALNRLSVQSGSQAS
jgi:hypothetical protein